MALLTLILGKIIGVGLHFLLSKNKYYRYYSRRVMFVGALCVASGIGIVASILLLPFRKNELANFITSRSAKYLIQLMGLKVIVVQFAVLFSLH